MKAALLILVLVTAQVCPGVGRGMRHVSDTADRLVPRPARRPRPATRRSGCRGAIFAPPVWSSSCRRMPCRCPANPPPLQRPLLHLLPPSWLLIHLLHFYCALQAVDAGRSLADFDYHEHHTCEHSSFLRSDPNEGECLECADNKCM